MGWLNFLICVLPVFFLHETEHTTFWVIALINGIFNFWSYGVMHNYASQSSVNKINQLQENLIFEENFDLVRKQAIGKLKPKIITDDVPNWISTVNLITFLVGFGLLVYSIWLSIS